ncbi:MAG: N-acetylmuramoyl-L-alanine amidase [Pseudomonadota bacterium]
MSKYISHILHLVRLAEKRLDIDSCDALLTELAGPGLGDRPFAPSLSLRGAARAKLASGDEAGQWSIDLIAHVFQAKRRIRYRRKTATGFTGLRLIAEGDSWFHYPAFLEDIVDQLDRNQGLAVRSLDGGTGDLGAMTAAGSVQRAVTEDRPDAVLLSVGGHDLLGRGRFETLLRPYRAGAKPGDLIDEAATAWTFARLIRDHRVFIDQIAQTAPGLPVLGHGYDVLWPVRAGHWLGQPLRAMGIPIRLGRPILRLILDAYNRRLAALAEEVPTFTHVDLRGVADRGAANWHDEIHPQSAGFARAAERFRQALQTVAPAQPARRGPVAVPRSAMLKRGPIVIDPGHGGAPGSPSIGGSSWNNAVGPNGTLEKALTLDIARRVRDRMTAAGHRVHLTRETDENLSLAARADRARACSAAAFVSLHFNGSDAHTAQGTETFVHVDASPASAELCRALQRALVAATGHRDRNALHPGGLKTARFGVLSTGRHSPRTAAVLAEISFLDRAAEEERLADTSYRDRIAQAIQRGIEAYLAGSGRRDLAAEGLSAKPGVARRSSRQPVRTPRAPAPDTLIPLPGAGAPHRQPALKGFGEAPAVAPIKAPDMGAAGARWEMRMVGRAQPSPPSRETVPAAAGALDLLDRPADGAPADRFDHAGFEEFVAGLGLKHFAPRELLFLGNAHLKGRSKNLNRLPDARLWANVAATARMLDAIRAKLDAPIFILSAYRCPEYNASVGGAANSLHCRFNAIDWVCADGTVSEWRMAAAEIRAANPAFEGGIGTYPRRRFVHIDTRGQRADWVG